MHVDPDPVTEPMTESAPISHLHEEVSRDRVQVVRHHPRIHGESKYGIGRTFKVLADMLTIKMITQFSSRPGRWFAMLSLPWLALGLLSMGTWLAGLWISGGTTTHGAATSVPGL